MSTERPFRPMLGLALVRSQGEAARLGEEPAPRPAGGWTFGLQSR